MNKRAITLICVFILLASLQMACSFSDLLGSKVQEAVQSAVQESVSHESQSSQNGDDPEGPSNEGTGNNNSQPAANQSGCTAAFAGSSNIPDGSQYQAGDTVEASFTLTNTGTCTWTSAYSLVMVGGDLTPSSEELSLANLVAPGESIMVEVELSAPSQDGVYLSVWKMDGGQGGIFGMDNPPDAPLRIKIRIVSSGNPQPTPSPTPNPQASNDQFTLLEDECFDYNSGSVVDCSDSSVDFMYNYSHPLPGQLFGYNDTTFGEHHISIPDLNTCQNDSYATLPHSVYENEYLCFRIETLASTTYGWIRVTHHNENGLTFDFDLLGTGTPLVTTVPNTNLFVESQGQQITLMEGECYDLLNGQKKVICLGSFAGFLFEEVTKKSLQVSQISPDGIQFAGNVSSEPSKTECMNASYSTSSIWPIQSTSYYCYEFESGGSTYYGWLRPTSFNLGGLTFDYLTWEASP